MKACYLILLFSISNLSVSGNDSAFVKIIFPKDKLDIRKTTMEIFDGINTQNIDLNEERIQWKGVINAEYGQLTIRYKISDSTFPPSENYFFKKGKALAVIRERTKDSIPFFPDEKKSSNIISYNKFGGPHYEKFVKDIKYAFTDYFSKNLIELKKSQEHLKVLFKLSDSLVF